ncbi:MAG TPA: hypothetical protein DCW29_15680 [Janthinobacterium sp.]|nr:hypothetical protein [Janthinobacterium sp.]
MKRYRSLLFAVVGVSFASSVAAIGISPKVTDANAPVAAPQYRSAFDVSATPVATPTPDKVWLQANKDVAGQSEHAMGGAAQMASAPASPAAEPASAPAPAPSAHQGHDMTMKGQ